MIRESNFPLISGYISLDLVNTEVVRNGTRYDLLTKSEDVINWVNTLLEENILQTKQISENVEEWASQVLPTLREIRSFLRKGYESLADGEDLSEGWINYLETVIEKAPFTYKVENKELIPVPIGQPSNVLISLVALDAIKLYTRNKLSSIHRCANPSCVLLFIDTRGRRKWCSMKICGNREKVTRFQRRQKQE
ncbi:hypothetical protein Pryu01_01519 [Paraliobacillus ryukyuensis]|uniref:Putative RNA-binding Zn ribbon-like protein n=1 Tax=Paraliobacillus ryukyuensis TaxID=200904 RepID=A0A366EC08_9BACI|nr:CGNR zinc finger domain-containing protein [Paraliobacillus ryukyuensis]RBO99862.1 putative RNA-binding Zn ribbon-like protein [Paraliobacillus ryukyuensis]